jgi:drug/metabolite transporter (DMT)-like permease
MSLKRAAGTHSSGAIVFALSLLLVPCWLMYPSLTWPSGPSAQLCLLFVTLVGIVGQLLLSEAARALSATSLSLVIAATLPLSILLEFMRLGRIPSAAFIAGAVGLLLASAVPSIHARLSRAG